MAVLALILGFPLIKLAKKLKVDELEKVKQKANQLVSIN
jgi:hypothetical protein